MKIKKTLRQLLCPHPLANVNFIGWSPYNDDDVLIVSRCLRCGKVIELELSGVDTTEWKDIVGPYKKYDLSTSL